MFFIEYEIRKEPVSGTMSTIEYRINGKEFGVEHEEGALISQPGGNFYSPQYLKNGSKAEIFIKNESYELVIEGGGWWIETPYYPVPRL